MSPDDEGYNEDFERAMEAALDPNPRRLDKIIKPLQQQERSLLTQAKRIDSFIPTSNNHLLEALTSQFFEIRVNAGINRLRLHSAEAAIIILTNGKKIVFAPLNLGTPHPKELREIGLFGKDTAGVSVAPKLSRRWFDSHNNYRIMAVFHFHPSGLGFSNVDIAYYDDDVSSVGEYKRDCTFGVFIPQWDKNHQKSEAPTIEQAVDLPTLRLLMFSGPATDTEYQDDKFERLTVERQVDLLRGSGMKVTLVNLPVSNSEVDLASLGSALK